MFGRENIIFESDIPISGSMISKEEIIDAVRVSGVQSGAVNVFCISSNCRYNAFTVCTKGYIVSFLPTTQMRLYMQERTK